MFMFVSSEYAERIREKPKLAEQVTSNEQEPMLPHDWAKEKVAETEESV